MVPDHADRREHFGRPMTRIAASVCEEWSGDGALFGTNQSALSAVARDGFFLARDGVFIARDGLFKVLCAQIDLNVPILITLTTH